MKKSCKTVLSLLLALCLCVGTAVASGVKGANLYFRTDSNSGETRYVRGAAAIGDTLYVMSFNPYGGSAMISKWKSGMEEPQTVRDDIMLHGYDDNGNLADATNITRVFTDGKCLYGFDESSFTVKKLMDETGAPTPLDALYKLDRTGLSMMDGENEVGGSDIGFFVQDGIIYVLTEIYAGEDLRFLTQYDLATGAVLKQESCKNIVGIAPYKDGKMLAVWREEGDNYDMKNERMIPDTLVSLDPKSMETATIASLREYGDKGVSYNAANDSIYFVSGSTVYRLADAGPVVSAYLPAEVYSGWGTDMVIMDGGLYVYSNLDGVVIRALDQPGIEDGALTVSGNGYMEQHRAVVAANPDMALTASDDYYSDMEQLTTAMLSGEDAVDVIALSSDETAISRLIAKGYAVELSAYPEIMSVASRMSDNITEKAMLDGKLYALPMQMQSTVLMSYNRGVLESLGLSEDDLPKTYMELLDFAANYYYDYGEDHPDINLFNGLNYRSTLLQNIIQNYVAYQMKTEGIVTFDTPLLRKLLTTLEAIDFTEIDPYAQLGVDVWSDEDVVNEFYERKYLFSGYCDITSPNVYEDEIFAPPLVLALDEGLEPVIPISVKMMIINPRTKHLEQAVRYVSEYAKYYSKVCENYTFFPDNNEELLNGSFEEQMEATRKEIERLKKQIENADAENKATLSEELKYREEAAENQEKRRILVTSEMAQKYHEEISPYLYVMEQTPLTDWSSEGGSEIQTLIQQYYDGATTMDAFIKEVNKRVRMMMLEDQ